MHPLISSLSAIRDYLWYEMVIRQHWFRICLEESKVCFWLFFTFWQSIAGGHLRVVDCKWWFLICPIWTFQPVQVSCIGEGPVVHLSPLSLDWGQIHVLTDTALTVTLSNESLIPAKFTLTVVSKDYRYFVSFFSCKSMNCIRFSILYFFLILNTYINRLIFGYCLKDSTAVRMARRT